MSVYESIVQEAKAIYEKSASECGKEYVNLFDIIKDVAMRNLVILDDEAIYDISSEIDPDYLD